MIDISLAVTAINASETRKAACGNDRDQEQARKQETEPGLVAN